MKIEFTADKELNDLMLALGSNSHFERLMEIFEARCNGLAVAAHGFKDKTYRMWAGGRVQELTDILIMYNRRHTAAIIKTPISASDHEF